MHIDEEELEEKMSQIIDQMGLLMMDIILMSFKKINTENLLLDELLKIRMQERKQENF
jgi:antitoxin component of RelBE/YafQ-DinJ toxin-antitoxin module